MADWCDVTGVGETVKGMTAIHWTEDGEEGTMWLHLKDPGLSYVALARLIDYFASTPVGDAFSAPRSASMCSRAPARAGPRRLRGDDPRVETSGGAVGTRPGKLA